MSKSLQTISYAAHWKERQHYHPVLKNTFKISLSLTHCLFNHRVLTLYFLIYETIVFLSSVPTATFLLSSTIASCKNTEVNFPVCVFTTILSSLQSILHRNDQKIITPGITTKNHLFYLDLKVKNKDQEKNILQHVRLHKLKAPMSVIHVFQKHSPFIAF